MIDKTIFHLSTENLLSKKVILLLLIVMAIGLINYHYTLFSEVTYFIAISILSLITVSIYALYFKNLHQQYLNKEIFIFASITNKIILISSVFIVLILLYNVVSYPFYHHQQDHLLSLNPLFIFILFQTMEMIGFIKIQDKHILIKTANNLKKIKIDTIENIVFDDTIKMNFTPNNELTLKDKKCILEKDRGDFERALKIISY